MESKGLCCGSRHDSFYQARRERALCAELVEQLRGHAGPRQVGDARFALQHNLGLDGACVVTLYSRN